MSMPLNRTLTERELKRVDKWDVSQGYGFQIGDIEKASPRRVLKLHSSINWLVSIFNGATSEGRICS